MAKTQVYFANPDKEVRAKEIISLVTGSVSPKTVDEQDRRERFLKHCQDAGVDPKSEDALVFIYEKLGGLVRTETEQKKAEENKKEMQARGRRRRIE